MLKHQPDLERPDTEIEEYLQDMSCTRNSSFDDRGRPEEIPGFTKNDSRVPAYYKEFLIQKMTHRKESASQFQPRWAKRG